MVSLLVDSGAKLAWDPKDSALNCLGDVNGRNEKFEYLLKKGIIPQLTDQQKGAALSSLSWDEAESLILNGVSANSSEGTGQPLLIRAATFNQCKVVQFLLEHGADPEHKNDQGRTALDIAKEVRHKLLAAKEREEPLPDLPNALASNKIVIRLLEKPQAASSMSCSTKGEE